MSKNVLLTINMAKAALVLC